MRVISSQDHRLFPSRELDMLDPFLHLSELQAPDETEHAYLGFERVTYVVADGKRFGFELWVNLPRGHKLEAPHPLVTAWDCPQDTSADGLARVRVVAGEALGLTGPLSTFTPFTLLDVSLSADTRFAHAFPQQEHGVAYVIDGEARIGGKRVHAGEAALLPAAALFTLATGFDGDARVLVASAAPLNQPIVRYGEFVMSSEDEVLAALKKRAA